MILTSFSTRRLQQILEHLPFSRSYATVAMYDHSRTKFHHTMLRIKVSPHCCRVAGPRA
jgi:hypothetical protein